MIQDKKDLSIILENGSKMKHYSNTDNPIDFPGGDDYDVVLDTLEKKYHLLWKMTEANMNADAMNIMDDIRLEQMDNLKEAIALWRKRK